MIYFVVDVINYIKLDVICGLLMWNTFMYCHMILYVCVCAFFNMMSDY